MKSVADYVSPESLRSLATPANLRLGEEIAKDEGVELVEFSPQLVTARVRPRGGLRRTVELRSTEEGLTWRCTCTRRGLFCKHCVAAALTTRKKSPARRK